MFIFKQAEGKSKTVQGLEAIIEDLAQRYGVKAYVAISLHGLDEPVAAQACQDLANELGAEREHYRILNGEGQPVRWYRTEKTYRAETGGYSQAKLSAFYNPEQGGPACTATES